MEIISCKTIYINFQDNSHAEQPRKHLLVSFFKLFSVFSYIANCKIIVICRNIFILCIGHAKFPDWMASWIARAREPTCKYREIAVATEAHWFINYTNQLYTLFKFFHNSIAVFPFYGIHFNLVKMLPLQATFF